MGGETGTRDRSPGSGGGGTGTRGISVVERGFWGGCAALGPDGTGSAGIRMSATASVDAVGRGRAENSSGFRKGAGRPRSTQPQAVKQIPTPTVQMSRFVLPRIGPFLRGPSAVRIRANGHKRVLPYRIAPLGTRGIFWRAADRRRTPKGRRHSPVPPCQSLVWNGEAGRPSLFMRFGLALASQPKRT
jgi:hypothetical protein